MREATAILSEPSRAGVLISALLDDQADLTAVERFAQFHEGAEAPLQGRYYRSLIPAAPPGPGRQYAFEVDLDRCSGCKACVAACHVLNGLDDDEAWRDVGMIVGRASGLPVIQHVTSSCHHCLEPACLDACPVDAYEKDPITGIVRHLDDQCIGCQYCTLACPYDAPKYQAAKGIVRKCDMCSGRLAAGEAPACVQACPHEAIRIRVVDRDEAAARGAAGEFLAAAPDPSHTLPTTRYLTARPLDPGARAADGHRDAPEHVHASLVLMLVLTQASAGAFAVVAILDACGVAGGLTEAILAAIGATLGHLGLVASLFHLGRPRFAYRALIGIGHSWLSREVAAFGAFATLATAQAALALAPPGWVVVPAGAATALAAATAAAGLAGLACSAMVYHATRRPFWHLRPSISRFAGTAAVLGPACLLVAASWGDGRSLGLWAALATVAATAVKLRFESRLIAPLDDPAPSIAQRSARLLKGPLIGAWRLRRSLGIVGGILLPIAWAATGPPMVAGAGRVVAVLALVVAIAGELAERRLFFAAVVRPKMPGGPGS